MTDKILKADVSGARQALAASHKVLVYADRGLGQGRELIRRDWVAIAPKAEGTLHRNIQGGRLALLMHEVVSRAAHGRFVEEGTGSFGPAKGRSGRLMLPDSGVAAIAAWIRRKGIQARKVSQKALPWIIARKIARDGTPAQPSAELALNVNRPRVNALVQAAILEGLRELGLSAVSA